jgi:hypothetical protein
MAAPKRNPAPAGRPGTGWIENEAGSCNLNSIDNTIGNAGEAFALAWLTRRGVRACIGPTVAALAGIGEASA